MAIDGFDLSTVPNLSEKEAAQRLENEGYNELPSSKKRSIFAIGLDVIREPMFLLLVACGAIYLILGNHGEALILLGFVFVVMGITLYQERKTERALEALRNLSSPRALVIRNGELRRIPGREVVRDDLVVLSEGDRVPADSILLSSLNLSVDESLLTGESIAVRKIAGAEATEMCRPGGDDLPYVYSGTLVVQGRGVARVRATGIHTEMGQIGKALQSVEIEETSIQHETGRLVGNLAVFGLVLCAVVVIVYGLTRGTWLNGVLAGITLAMAMLPEEFPVVLTIFLALGAWRISQKQVLTRRVAAIETLGSATVLCVDKTGTLTLNRMSVSKLFAKGSFHAVGEQSGERLPENFHELLEFSILAGQQDPFDPMEKALKQLGEQFLLNTEHIHDHWELVYQYPLSQDLLALSHVWRSSHGSKLVVAAKGAPEAIADLCHLDESQSRELSQHVSDLAGDGLRVLGVAKTCFEEASLPDEQHDFNFEFLGLVGFADPVRPSVPAAVKECYDAGIRLIMITGDYPDTAQSIARKIGLAGINECITGLQMDAMDDEELQQRVRTVNIFARVVPEQKLRLVNALKAGGEVVAMTGDGVNDAPALKSAHIGIAMGGRGTDVARESAALVLLNDDFSSIVETVKMGRRIYDNLRKAMAYILAIHVPIAGMSLIPVLIGWPLVLYPVHIAFLELIIDPACSLVFEAEPEEADIMKHPPRNLQEKLFGSRFFGISLLQGFSLLAIVFGVYASGLCLGHSESDARALTFTTLVVANLGLIFANRSWSSIILRTLRTPNAALWWVVGISVIFLGLVLYVPFLRDLFDFSTLHLIDLEICLIAGIASVMWFESLKWFKQKTHCRS